MKYRKKPVVIEAVQFTGEMPCLLARGINLDAAPVRKRLDVLVPLRQAYLKTPVEKRGRSLRAKSRRLTTREK